MYKAIISFKEKDIEIAKKLFLPEMGERDRSSIKLEAKDDKISFIIEAKDATALRSTLHGITKLLEVYENGRQKP